MSISENSIREILEQKWNMWAPTRNKNPSRDRHEFDAGKEVFIKIAKDSLTRTGTAQLESKYACGYSEGIEDKGVDRLKAFMDENASTYILSCLGGFPFSKLDNSLCEKTLFLSLKEDATTVLTHFLNICDADSISSSLYLKKAVANMDCRDVSTACFRLYEQYKNGKRDTSGHDILLLLEQASNSEFHLPPRKTFRDWDLLVLLSNILLNPKETISRPKPFIEILLFHGLCSKYLFQSFMGRTGRIAFLEYMLLSFMEIPSDEWKNKKTILIDLQERIVEENKHVLSEDQNSLKEIIDLLGTILDAPSDQEAKGGYAHLLMKVEMLNYFMS